MAGSAAVERENRARMPKRTRCPGRRQRQRKAIRDPAHSSWSPYRAGGRPPGPLGPGTAPRQARLVRGTGFYGDASVSREGRSPHGRVRRGRARTGRADAEAHPVSRTPAASAKGDPEPSAQLLVALPSGWAPSRSPGPRSGAAPGAAGPGNRVLRGRLRIARRAEPSWPGPRVERENRARGCRSAPGVPDAGSVSERRSGTQRKALGHLNRAGGRPPGPLDPGVAPRRARLVRGTGFYGGASVSRERQSPHVRGPRVERENRERGCRSAPRVPDAGSVSERRSGTQRKALGHLNRAGGRPPGPLDPGVAPRRARLVRGTGFYGGASVSREGQSPHGRVRGSSAEIRARGCSSAPRVPDAGSVSERRSGTQRKALGHLNRAGGRPPGPWGPGAAPRRARLVRGTGFTGAPRCRAKGRALMAGLDPATRSSPAYVRKGRFPRQARGGGHAGLRIERRKWGRGRGRAGCQRDRRNGAACQTRTDDLRITNAMLYQLS